MAEISYTLVAQKFRRGRVVPFLGAGVNRVGRTVRWTLGDPGSLPDGRELAEHFANAYHYLEHVRGVAAADDSANGGGNGEAPDPDPATAAQLLDLARVSQFVALTTDEQQLYDDLHDIFASVYESNEVHRFLARFPSFFRERKLEPQYQLIVTTNYDDALERAFKDVDEPVDLLYYASDQYGKGWFWHVDPDGNENRIKDSTAYDPTLLDERTAILKIHGAVNRANPARDSFVITEDDYIDYLAYSGIAGLLPAKLRAKMAQSNFLFLGYSMRDWNVRALLQRVWSERQRGVQSWAILLGPDELERMFWDRRSVEILEVRLEEYVEALQAEVARQLDAQAQRAVGSTS